MKKLLTELLKSKAQKEKELRYQRHLQKKKGKEIFKTLELYERELGT